MNRLHLKKIFSGIFLVSILTVTGTLSSLICPAKTVRASDTLSNPKITDDSSLYAGKKVTWDCVWLGSYPQSEVTAENGQIYEKLKAADDSQWDENGDITIGNYKYRRLCRSQTDVSSLLAPDYWPTTKYSQTYDIFPWEDDSTWHYFRYEPLKWRVLKMNKSTAFLLADKIFYRGSLTDIPDFFNNKLFFQIFSSEEQAAVVDTTRNNYKPSVNKLFLLSNSEAYGSGALAYGFTDVTLLEDNARRAKCTDFAFAQNVWRDKRPQYAGNCNWRLETYGTTRALYDSVQTTGEIMKTSMASQDYYPLRPAMYVDLSKVNYLSAGTVSSNNTMFEKNAMVINENETPTPNKPENPVYKVKKIRLSGLSHKIAAGKKLPLKATISPSNATNKALQWKSSNTKVATISSKGVVTLKKNSGGKSVTITALAKDGSKVQGSFKITSMKGIVKKLKVTAPSKIKAGKSTKLKAVVTASAGANKALTFTSSNTKYMTVSSKGIVKALKAGKGKTVKITAAATDGSGRKATVSVKVY